MMIVYQCEDGLIVLASICAAKHVIVIVCVNNSNSKVKK